MNACLLVAGWCQAISLQRIFIYIFRFIKFFPFPLLSLRIFRAHFRGQLQRLGTCGLEADPCFSRLLSCEIINNKWNNWNFHVKIWVMNSIGMIAVDSGAARLDSIVFANTRPFRCEERKTKAIRPNGILIFDNYRILPLKLRKNSFRITLVDNVVVVIIIMVVLVLNLILILVLVLVIVIIISSNSISVKVWPMLMKKRLSSLKKEEKK